MATTTNNSNKPDSHLPHFAGSMELTSFSNNASKKIRFIFCAWMWMDQNRQTNTHRHKHTRAYAKTHRQTSTNTHTHTHTYTHQPANQPTKHTHTHAHTHARTHTHTHTHTRTRTHTHTHTHRARKTLTSVTYSIESTNFSREDSQMASLTDWARALEKAYFSSAACPSSESSLRCRDSPISPVVPLQRNIFSMF